MKELNMALILSKMNVKDKTYYYNYFDRGLYNKVFRVYMKKYHRKSHIIDMMKSDEDLGLYNLAEIKCNDKNIKLLYTI